MKRNVLACLLCFLTILAVGATDYRYDKNIHYRPAPSSNTYTDSMCVVDIAYPADAKNAPVVVWFHGGGLTAGHRELPTELQKNGLVVVGVEYRLSPKATTDEMLDDAAAAVAWTFDNIEKFGGSKEKIYLSGHSAGGYLIDMVGLDKSLLAKYGKDADNVAGLIPFSGQVVTHYETRRQQGIEPLQPTIDKYAPLYHVRKDCAPILIISGDREMELYGRYEEAAYFYRLFKLLKHPDATLYELDGYDHGSMVIASYPLLHNFIKAHESKKAENK